MIFFKIYLNVKNNFYKIALLIVIFIFSLDHLYAAKKNHDIDLSVGSKGVYSSGISEPYMYNMTGGKVSYKREYLGIGTSLNQYFNYQVTDGNGEYDYRSFSEAGASLEIFIDKYLILSGEYSRAKDFNNLTGNTYDGDIEFQIADAVFSASYLYRDFNYEIASNDIELTGKDFRLGIDYYVNDSLGFDLAYSYNTLYINSLESDYRKNIFRAGCIYTPLKKLFFTAGAAVGKDSEEYTIIGADLSITLFFSSRFKLNFYYSLSSFNPPPAGISSGGSSTGGNSSKAKTNPYLTSDKVGEAYYSQIINFGITVIF